MAAILVFQNNETTAILVSQANSVGVEIFFFSLRRSFLLFQKIYIDTGHLSKNALFSIPNMMTIAFGTVRIYLCQETKNTSLAVTF